MGNDAWWPVAMNMNRIAQAAAVVALVGSLSACPADTDPESTPTDDVATSEAPAEETDAPAEEPTDDSLEEDMDTDAPAEEDTDAPAEEESPTEEATP